MKVYLLTYTYWDQKYIIGIYSTENKAYEGARLNSGSGRTNRSNYSIKEMYLDENT